MMEKGSKLPQFLATAAACLSTLASGAVFTWTSPVLPTLQKDGGPLGSPINKEQSSWIVSIMGISAMVGCFVMGYFGDKWGRKQILLSSTVPFLIGWTLVATARHIIQLYIGRFITAFASIIPMLILPMYCGEIVETSIRGTLCSFLMIFFKIGNLYCYVIGPFVSYVVFCILCAIVPVTFFVCFIMMPESPYFLLRKGRRNEAIASLARLRSKSEAAVQMEADEIQMIFHEDFKNQSNIWDLFKVKGNFKALMYTCVIVFFRTFTGMNTIVVYMHNIFIAAGGIVPMEIAPIVIGGVQVLATMVTPIFIDKSGRKILLVFSGIGETISLSALGLYFYLKEVQHADDVIEKLSWLPVVALIIFVVSYNLGWGSVLWVMISEMFALNIKAKATSISIFTDCFLFFIISKFSSNLEELFNGKYAIFWIFTGFCFLSIFFTFLLPETKGKTFQQIQDELNGVTSTVNVEKEEIRR